MLAALVRAQSQPADGPPKVLEPAPLEYPAKLREQRITGWARIALRIGEQGEITEAKVNEETTSEFGQAALAAARRFKFQPAYKAGRPCAMPVILPFVFDFDDADFAEMEAHRTKEVLPPGPPTVEISAAQDWPELKDEVRPKTPAALQDRNWMGEATIGFVVDETGIPRDVHLVEATEVECVAPAIAAVRQWKFFPGRVDNQPVRVALEVPIVFFPESNRSNGARVKPGVSRRINRWKPGPDVSAGSFQPPRAIKKVMPAYPEEMRSLDIDGEVTVEVVIDAFGRVTHVRTIKAENMFFGVLAERALSYWTFAPASRGGMPVPCRFRQGIRFMLYGGPARASGGHAAGK